MPAGPTPHGDVAGADASREQARELGAHIAAARENAGLSIEQVAEATRIRATLVRAIEAGDFAPCGGHVYARGHLRAIATALHIDGPELLAAYDQLSGQTDTFVRTATAEDRVEAGPAVMRGLGGGGGDRRHPPSGWLIAAVAAAAILAVGIGVSVVRSGGGGTGDGSVAAPKPSVGASEPGSVRPSEPTPSASQTVAYAGVNVVVNVHDGNSWVHASDETGATIFQGTLTNGMSKEFHAAQRIKFVFGYARAVDLVVNGKSIGQPPVGASEVSTVSVDANTAASGQLG